MKEINPQNDCQHYGRLPQKGESMKRLVTKTCAAITALSLMTLGLMLAGCGGSGGELSSQVVSGTAAVGAPLSGQVSLKDSSSPAQQKTTVIGSDGSYAIDVTGMKAPYVLQASGSAGGMDYKLHSYADATGTANINPLSNVIVASAAEVDDPSEAYEKADSDRNHKIRDNLSKTVSLVLAKLEPLLKRYNVSNTNPITTRYIANHLDLDEMFDNVKITVSNGNLSIVNAKSGAVIFSGKVTDIANGVFTNDDGNLPPAPALPVAPSGLTAVGGSGQVTLSWAAVGNATSYNVYYATTPGLTTTSGRKIAAAATPYVQAGLAAGTAYYYIVTAVNSAGESAASAQASANTTATPPVPTLPAAPTGVIATGGTNQVTLSWNVVSTATSYNVYYSTTAGVTKANGTKITNATNPAVQPGLAAGATYYYIVTALNSDGEGPASVQVAATTIPPVPVPTAPAAPTGVSATGGVNQATISWTAAAGATSHNVYWSTTPGVTKASGTKIAGVTSPYVKTALSAGTAYYFIVTAANSVGESAASAQAVATTSAAPPAIPSAPTGATATGGANQVSVAWSAVTGATSYNIYWSTTSGVTTAGTKITGATSPYVQTGLAASTAYYYSVTAVNSAGESVASAQATATTNAPVVTIPAAPTGVTATGGASQVSISWSAVAGATSYNVYYSTTTGVTKTSGAKITNATSPCVQTGLSAGTAYYYIVTAANSAGESASSTQVTATTNAAPPPACGDCHAIPPDLGSHSFHTFTTCATCHGAGYSATTVNAATHMNGVKNLISTLGWNATTQTCATPSCHGSRSW